MKNDIKTGIITPTSRYYDTNATENKALFELQIMNLLNMPDNWRDYFQFTSSSDYLTLQDKEWYKATKFRRFKKGIEAILPADLKKTLMEHIDYEIRRVDAVDQKSKRETSYKEMVSKFLCNEGEWRITYHNENEGIKIYLIIKQKSLWNDEMEDKEISSTSILHNGSITLPVFETRARYYSTIKDAQNFIDLNKEYNDKLISKAKEVKALLPVDFFILKETNTTTG